MSTMELYSSSLAMGRLSGMRSASRNTPVLNGVEIKVSRTVELPDGNPLYWQLQGYLPFNP